jgi:hypothetical protein
MDGGEKAAAPGAVAGSEDLSGDEGDEGGEVFVFASESVADPGTKAGAAEAFEAGEGEELGGSVIELFGVEGFDETEVIGNSLEMREEVGDFEPGLTALFEGELVVFRGTKEIGLFADEGELFAFEELVGAELAGAFLEFWFEVEEVEVGGGSDHVDVDDAFGLGGVVEAEFGKGVGFGAEGFLLEEAGERGGTQSKSGLLKKESTGGGGMGHDQGLVIVSSRFSRVLAR